jgi:fructose-1,6-bisphosphatase/sedoheptulose 1,7-bisphosphatase-like protein
MIEITVKNLKNIGSVEKFKVKEFLIVTTEKEKHNMIICSENKKYLNRVIPILIKQII